MSTLRYFARASLIVIIWGHGHIIRTHDYINTLRTLYFPLQDKILNSLTSLDQRSSFFKTRLLYNTPSNKCFSH